MWHNFNVHINKTSKAEALRALWMIKPFIQWHIMCSYSRWWKGGLSRELHLGSSPSFLPHSTPYCSILRGTSEQCQVWPKISQSSCWPYYPFYRRIKVKYLINISNTTWGVRPSLNESFILHASVPEEIFRWFLGAICSTVVPPRVFHVGFCSPSWIFTTSPTTHTLYQGVILVSLKNQLPYPP